MTHPTPTVTSEATADPYSHLAIVLFPEDDEDRPIWPQGMLRAAFQEPLLLPPVVALDLLAPALPRAKRHHMVLRDQGARGGVNENTIRRLARKGGVKRMAHGVYSETRALLRRFLLGVIRDTLEYTDHACRKTVTAMDVVYALKKQGSTLYGFGG
jgi:histone H4